MTPNPNKYYEATLSVAGRDDTTGHTYIDSAQRKGTFFPSDAKTLDTPYPEATLTVTELSLTVPISGVHQCPASRLHWEYHMRDTTATVA